MPPPAAVEAPPDVRMTFGEHLEELRRRLVKSLVALLAAFAWAIAWYKDLIWFVVLPHQRVMAWLQVPPGEADLLTAAYTKPIWAVMKLSFIVAVFVASPYVGYQLWKFVAAGLYPRERRYVGRYAPLSFLLFAGGCVFGYLVLIPYGLYGMAHMFQLEGIRSSYILSDYLDLVMGLTIVTGAVFQLPLVMTFLTSVGLATPRTWGRWFRIAIVLIFVAAAILTPTPDIFTQVLLAVPLLLLYLMGWGLSFLVAPAANRP